MSRTAEIKVTVDLDGNNLPTRIEWSATDAESDVPVECQSLMLSVWDSASRSSAAIDLWTAETTVDDMNLHFFQMFHKLADTYRRATHNDDVARRIQEFGDGFGKAMGLK